MNIHFKYIAVCRRQALRDHRQLHWFQRFLEDQQIKKEGKNSHSSGLFTLRSAKLAWKKDKHKGEPWNANRLVLYCTVDTRFWSAEGTQLASKEKEAKLLKTIDNMKKKGELTANQQAFVQKKHATLAKLHNSVLVSVPLRLSPTRGLTAFPLIKLLTPYSGDEIAKKAMTQVLISGGIYFNLIMIWQFFRFSNFFPIILSFTDKVAIISLLFLICQNLYSDYRFFKRETINSFSIKFFMSGGTYSIILALLPLLPLLISGQAWIERISSLYPLESLLYMKVSFLLLVAINILSFAATLLSKKIINYKIVSIFALLPLTSIPFSILELIQHKEEMTINFFIGMF